MDAIQFKYSNSACMELSIAEWWMFWLVSVACSSCLSCIRAQYFLNVYFSNELVFSSGRWKEYKKKKNYKLLDRFALTFDFECITDIIGGRY